MCRWPAARKRASLSAEGRLRGRGSCCKVLAAWQLCRLGFLLTLARGLLPGSFYNLESQAPSERPESLLASPCAGSMLALLLFSWLAVSSSRCGSGRGCFRLITLPLWKGTLAFVHLCRGGKGARGLPAYASKRLPFNAQYQLLPNCGIVFRTGRSCKSTFVLPFPCCKQCSQQAAQGEYMPVTLEHSAPQLKS